MLLCILSSHLVASGATLIKSSALISAFVPLFFFGNREALPGRRAYEPCRGPATAACAPDGCFRSGPSRSFIGHVRKSRSSSAIQQLLSLGRLVSTRPVRVRGTLTLEAFYILGLALPDKDELFPFLQCPLKRRHCKPIHLSSSTNIKSILAMRCTL
ncbi:hypothetical protein F4811DRAFT_231440 [Daldinia bambusicola]|nr:hypothetical protein F4811DRAFT_231440 [Daldinia bambusicola]